jgi:hypothetical protein
MKTIRRVENKFKRFLIFLPIQICDKQLKTLSTDYATPPENGILIILIFLKLPNMQNLKKLASKILERQGISHERLKPRK